MRKKTPVILIFISIFFYSCNQDSRSSLMGTYDLGRHWVRVEHNKDKNSLIYCTDNNSLCCDDGFSMIPKSHDTTGQVMQEAIADKRWIVARSIQNDSSLKYWIIDKDFTVDLQNCEATNCHDIIEAHMIGPLDLQDFSIKKKELGITLVLSK